LSLWLQTKIPLKKKKPVNPITYQAKQSKGADIPEIKGIKGCTRYELIKQI
jgi:hypothetical protein